MGYYTYYSLQVGEAVWKNGLPNEGPIEHISKERVKELEEEINRMNVFEHVCFEAYQRDKDGNNVLGLAEYGGAWCNAKWYDSEEDMIALSVRFPEFFFTLSGDGEEQGDIWESWYCNGMTFTDRAEIVFPKYDPKLMAKSVNNMLFSPNYRYSYE